MLFSVDEAIGLEVCFVENYAEDLAKELHRDDIKNV